MAFEIPSDLMVSVSGVRGRVGAGLTPEVVARFASAFGAYVRERSGKDRPRVVLGRDTRTSGAMFLRVVAGALQSVGCDVIEIGIAPTPTALFNIRALDADGGIVVTASHNPVEWNALKLASGAGMFLDAHEAPLMRAFVDNAESSGVEQLRAAGMDVGELSTEQKSAFQEALVPAYEQYYKTYSKDLIDQIIATE